MEENMRDELMKRIKETEKEILSIERSVETCCNGHFDDILLFNLNNQLMTMKILAELPDVKIMKIDPEVIEEKNEQEGCL